MKKTLLSLCALALSLTTSAQMMNTPEGKLIDNMYRSSDSWVKKGWIGKEPGKYEGLVSKIVEGKDGNIYVYNPLSGLNSKSWLKLEKGSNGNYRAVLPQAIDKDNYGGDDDDESANTERILMLNRMINNGSDKYEVVSSDKNFMEFSWDGKTLKMLGVGTKNEMLALTYNNVLEGNYGDWGLTIETLTTPLVTPPTGAEQKQFLMTAKGVTTPRIVDAALSGDDIYLKGIFKSSKLANIWVKLSKEGDKYVLLTNQYLGTTVKTDFMSYSSDKSEYHTYAAAFSDDKTVADRLEFTIDAAKGTLTTDKILKIVMGKSSAANLPKDDLESFENIVLTPYQQKAGKPATPKLHYCSSTPSYDYTTTTITLAFYVKNVDVDGNYLNPDNMYYNVYINENTEPFKFEKSKFFYLEQDMINIPFNYKDKKNDDIKIVDDQRILHFYDTSIKKLSVVMVYEEGDKKYVSEPMTAQLPATTGIDATTNKNAAEQYFSIDGRRLQHLEKGLNIVKSADGTTRKVMLK